MAARVTLKGDLTKRMKRGEKRAAQIVETTAKGIQRGAMARSRVDTMRMRNGWQIAQISEHKWQVGNAVSYVIFNELGTYKMSAQPMLYPSAEEAIQPFHRKMRKAYER